jgi:hypothetical protein
MTTRILFTVAAAFSLVVAFSSVGSAMAATYQCQVGDMAQAKDDVDVYDSPVDPRAAYDNYFMREDTQGKVLARHEDGWCKLKGVAPGGGDGWVAEDHLQAEASTGGGGGGGAETGGGTAPGGGGGGGAPAAQPIKHDCKDLGPNEGAAGGSADPKEKFECEDLGGGNKRCCWVTYP